MNGSRRLRSYSLKLIVETFFFVSMLSKIPQQQLSSKILKILQISSRFKLLELKTLSQFTELFPSLQLKRMPSIHLILVNSLKSLNSFLHHSNMSVLLLSLSISLTTEINSVVRFLGRGMDDYQNIAINIYHGTNATFCENSCFKERCTYKKFEVIWSA